MRSDPLLIEFVSSVKDRAHKLYIFNHHRR